jgi:hypothetical protein
MYSTVSFVLYEVTDFSSTAGKSKRFQPCVCVCIYIYIYLYLFLIKNFFFLRKETYVHVKYTRESHIELQSKIQEIRIINKGKNYKEPFQ